VHRGSPAGDLDRLTLIAEFHSAAKCPVLDVLGLGLPRPSGDQWLVLQRRGEKLKLSVAADGIVHSWVLDIAGALVEREEARATRPRRS